MSKVCLQGYPSVMESISWWSSSQDWPSFIVQTSWHRHPLSSIQNCPWLVFITKSIQASSPAKPPEPQLLRPGSPFLPADLVPEIVLSICPYALELPPWGNCPVQVFVFLQNGCSFPSCVICVCFILFCLVLFNLPYSLLFLVIFLSVPFVFWLVYLGTPLVYCSSILGFAWLHAECYK